MLFNSLHFLVFLPIVWLTYVTLKHRQQNLLMLAASYYFYGSWDWRFLSLLLLSTLVDYHCSRAIYRLQQAADKSERKKVYLLGSIACNLGILGFFKYCNFFTQSAHDFLLALGSDVDLPTLNIILPVGISFYTFQTMSYTIDVYRGDIKPASSLLDFALYVSFFPQLVAGPIERGTSLLPQIETPRRLLWDEVRVGLHLIVWGYFKKCYIADGLAPAVNQVFATESPGGFETLVAIYAFSVQIYCDFSGYTDIARGVAKLFGFELMLNFNLPYFSTNPQQFWTRWHISLSSWLRDYLYIPLGGSRSGPGFLYRNLMLTMILGGLWHGAAWNFVLWGLYQGAILVVHRRIHPILARWIKPTTPHAKLAYLGIRLIVMYHMTCYGWLLFRAGSWRQITTMTSALSNPFANYDWAKARTAFLLSLPLVLVQTVQAISGRLDFLGFSWMPLELKAAVYSALIYFIIFKTGQAQDFIYFQF